MGGGRTFSDFVNFADGFHGNTPESIFHPRVYQISPEITMTFENYSDIREKDRLSCMGPAEFIEIADAEGFLWEILDRCVTIYRRY